VVATLVLAALISQTTAYRVDAAASEAGFDLKATMHTVHGSTKGVSGEVRVEPEGAGVLKLSGRIEITAASLETGNSRRDATMRSKSLIVDSYPKLVFEPERFEPSSPQAPDGSIPGALTGKLTVRGQTRPQAITATLTPRGERIVAHGSFDVRWAEFGVPDPSFFMVRIEALAHAHFRAEFVPVP
jgi:polyisoprenoid-binding protein YceI